MTKEKESIVYSPLKCHKNLFNSTFITDTSFSSHFIPIAVATQTFKIA